MGVPPRHLSRQVFAPDDPLVRGNMAMLRAVEAQGLVFDTGWLKDGIWTYFGSFYGTPGCGWATARRRRGVITERGKRARRLLAVAQPQPGVAVERTEISPDAVLQPAVSNTSPCASTARKHRHFPRTSGSSGANTCRKDGVEERPIAPFAAGCFAFGHADGQVRLPEGRFSNRARRPGGTWRRNRHTRAARRPPSWSFPTSGPLR